MRGALTPQQALLKAANYCAYQERCHAEVEERLAEWGVYGHEAASIIARLIQDGYINEERFAKAYAGGKFRVKQWGRVKIKLGLKTKKVSEYCIRQAMKEIDEDQYLETLEELAMAKLAVTKGGSKPARHKKVALYLQAKGYEVDLIWAIIKKLDG
jgi:regulatory protein